MNFYSFSKYENCLDSKKLRQLAMLVFFAFIAVNIGKETSAFGEALDISGAKTFKVNSNTVKGNYSQFINENPEEQSGFSLDQSLRVQVDGNVTENISVKAALDDTKIDKEQKEITVFIDGRYWDATLGDFHLELEESEFALYKKKVQGVLITGKPMKNLLLTTIVTRSQGESKSEEFMGKGAIEEYRLSSYPVIENSDVVQIAGQTMQRGTDYFIDYEDGSIFFERAVLPIEPDVKVSVTYEYIPGGRPYKRSLSGFRLAGILGEKRTIGYNYVQDIDNRRQPVLEITPESPKPAGKSVYSLDVLWSFNPWLTLKAEAAYSEKDDNLLSEYLESDKLITGHAHMARLTLDKPKFKLDHYRVFRSPTFFTIGKDDLSVDLQKWKTSVETKPRPGWEVIADMSRARKRIINDPDPELTVLLNPITIRSEDASGTIARKWRTSSMTLYGYRDNRYNISEGIDNVKRIGRLSADRRMGVFNANTALQIERFENALDRYSFKDTVTRTYGLNFSPSENIIASVERVDIGVQQDFDKDGSIQTLRESLTDTRKLDLSFSRKYNASLLHLDRSEADYSTDSFMNTVTADLKFRARPNRAISSDVRYSEQHIEKFVRTLLGTREENPVRTRNAAIRLNLRQSKRTTWNFRFNHMDEADMKKRLQESWTDRWEIKLRTAPRKSLSTELKYKRSIRERRKYLILDPRATTADRSAARDDVETELSMTARQSFGKSLVFSFTVGRKWNVDRKDGEGDTNMIQKSLNVEHGLTRNITLKGGIIRNDGEARDDGEMVPSKEWTNTYGAEFTPFKQMKISVNHLDKLRDTNFAVKNSENRVDLDYLLSNDTRLTGAYRILDSGPSTENVDGYKANMATLDLVVRF